MEDGQCDLVLRRTLNPKPQKLVASSSERLTDSEGLERTEPSLWRIDNAT